MKILSVERLGQINKNKHGSLMKIIKYNNANDILVEFIESGYNAKAQCGHFKKGEIKDVYDKTVFGIGYIGHGSYKPSTDRKNTSQYKSWQSMLRRCYDHKYQKRQPTYKDCKVCVEWHNFQNFAAWYDENYYEIEGERIELDKDILMKGNKIYSPETCVFVPQSINSLFIKSNAKRGSLPIGVNFDKIALKNKYIASCSKKREDITIGRYETIKEAFYAYKEFKENIIKQVAVEYKSNIPNKLYQAMINYKIDITD